MGNELQDEILEIVEDKKASIIDIYRITQQDITKIVLAIKELRFQVKITGSNLKKFVWHDGDYYNSLLLWSDIFSPTYKS